MLRDDADGALEEGDGGGGDGVVSEAAGSSALGSWVLSVDGRDWWWWWAAAAAGTDVA